MGMQGWGGWSGQGGSEVDRGGAGRGDTGGARRGGVLAEQVRQAGGPGSGKSSPAGAAWAAGSTWHLVGVGGLGAVERLRGQTSRAPPRRRALCSLPRESSALGCADREEGTAPRTTGSEGLGASVDGWGRLLRG